MVILTLGDYTAKIDSGELVSFIVQGHEYIHQKESPGWRNSDTEMFPIIGPTAAADYLVKTPRGNAVQDQHGILREMDYVLVEQSESKVIFQKCYIADTKIKNSKFPDKSSVEILHWPYDFKFEKQFELSEDNLSITFKISGEKGMPFMLGYHPAFKILTEQPYIVTENRIVSLSEVLQVGNRALHLQNCESLVLQDSKGLSIKTYGFGDFMLWTAVSNMICIEPITFYPYAVPQQDLDEGFMILEQNEAEFVVQIIP